MNMLSPALAEVAAWIDGQLSPLPEETVPLAELCGRVLAYDVKCKHDVPSFERAIVDGFAVRSADVRQAAEKPVALQLVGVVRPGVAPSITLESGRAAEIIAGAALPHGADAVVPVTDASVEDRQVIVTGAVASGDNVERRGEDIAAGARPLTAGRRLRPHDVSLLSQMGVPVADVTRQVRVRVVATGDELAPAGVFTKGPRVPDANSPMLACLIDRDGGIPLASGIVHDDPAAILAALQDEGDIVLVTGGSRVGPIDHAATLVAKHGELKFDGLPLRPGHQTGVGRMEHRLVFLLPGNPLECLCAYDAVVGPVIRQLSGASGVLPYRTGLATLAADIASTAGQLDYVCVKLAGEIATPIPTGRVAVLAAATEADGFVLVPAEAGKLAAGSEVEVYLYD